jgi:GntR family transcriptional regulator, carbon starvation induced regulator
MAMQDSPTAILSDLDGITSLSERAYRLLRQKILHGDIQAKVKLKIETLQREYNLSSSPLREALNRLAAEGLVTMDENRGFRVAAMSLEDFQDITFLRLVAEPAALANAIGAATDEWEAKIVAAFHRLKRIEERVLAPQYYFDDDWTERHRNFHMALYSACTSTRLYTLCWNLFDQAERYRRMSAIRRTEPRDIAGEHRALMDAALARDANRAAELIREHIQKTAGNLRALFSE